MRLCLWLLWRAAINAFIFLFLLPIGGHDLVISQDQSLFCISDEWTALSCDDDKLSDSLLKILDC